MGDEFKKVAVGDDQSQRQQGAENRAHCRMNYHLTKGWCPRVFLHNQAPQQRYI
jgi:hypothetical protein